MTFVTYILLAMLFFYTNCLILLLVGLSRLQPGGSTQKPPVSVVLAARNEEKNIRACLNALKAQEYPGEKTEFIVIDDRSTDNTHRIIDEFVRADPRFHEIRIREENPDMAPKKWALHRGIEKASGEILLTTDADCTPPPRWIETMTRCFENRVGLVAGFSPLDRIEKPSLFHRLLALDGLALAGVAAGAIGMGRPLTCTGRNLAYRKSVYEEVGGFTSIGRFVSGDDDLFLQLVRRKTDREIGYALNPDTYVGSLPPDTLVDFFHQRTRHASKGFHYPAWLTLSLMIVYSLDLVLLLGWMLPGLGTTWMAALAVKLALEFLFIARAGALFHRKNWLGVFPLAAPLHIPYVVIFGLWAQLGSFRWKGRPHKKLKRGGKTG